MSSELHHPRAALAGFLCVPFFLTMNEYIPIRDQSCPNRHCPFFSKVMGGNVTVHSRVQRRFRCKECGQTWVEHRSEFRYGLRSCSKKITAAMQCSAKGFSVRAAAVEVGVSPSTIQRWRKRKGSKDCLE